MKKKLLEKLNELIEISPSNWAEQAAIEMNITVSAVRMIKCGKIGKKSIDRLTQLVEVMKKISAKNVEKINKALA